MKRTKRRSPLRAGKVARRVSVAVTPITAYFKPKASPNKPLQATNSNSQLSPSKSFKLLSTFFISTDSNKKATTLQPVLSPKEIECSNEKATILQPVVSPKEVERSSSEKKQVTPTSLGLDSLKISEDQSHSHTPVVGKKSPKRCINDSQDKGTITDLMCVDIEMITPSPKKQCTIDLTESPIIIVDSIQECPSPVVYKHTKNVDNTENMMDEVHVCTKSEVAMELAEGDSTDVLCHVTNNINEGPIKCEQGQGVDDDGSMMIISGEGQAECESKVKVQKRDDELCNINASDQGSEHELDKCDLTTQHTDASTTLPSTLVSLKEGKYDSESPLAVVPEEDQVASPLQSRNAPPSQPLHNDESSSLPDSSQSISKCLESERSALPPTASSSSSRKEVIFSTPESCSDSITGDDISVYAAYKTPLHPTRPNKPLDSTTVSCSGLDTSGPSVSSVMVHVKCRPVLEKGLWSSSVVALEEVSPLKQFLEEVDTLLRQRGIFNIVRNPGSKVKLFGSTQRSVMMNLLELNFRSLSNKIHSSIEFLMMATSPLTMPGSEMLVGLWDMIIDPHTTSNNVRPDVLNECLTWFHRLLILHPPGQHSLVDNQYSCFLRAIGGETTFGLWEIIASLHNGPRYHTQLLSFIVDLLLLDARASMTSNKLDDSLFVSVFWSSRTSASDCCLTSPIRKLIDSIVLLLQDFTFTDLDCSKLDNLMSLLFLVALRCSDLQTELLLVCQKLTSCLSFFISHLRPQPLCEQLINKVPLLKESFNKVSQLELHDFCAVPKACTNIQVKVASENEMTQVPRVDSVEEEDTPQAKNDSSGSEQMCETDTKSVLVNSSPQAEETGSDMITCTTSNSNSSSESLNCAVSCDQENKKSEEKDVKDSISNNPPSKPMPTTIHNTRVKSTSLKLKGKDTTKTVPIVTRNRSTQPVTSKPPLSKFIVTRSTTAAKTLMAKSSVGLTSQPVKQQTVTKFNDPNVKTKRGSGGPRRRPPLKTNTVGSGGGVKKGRKVGGHSCENCKNGRCARCRQTKAAVRNPWK